jgi:hypothetical protein
MLKTLKKFSLLILTICMVIGLLPTATYAATAKDEFIYDFTEAFAGHWYNAAGQQMLTITRNEINGCFIMETLDQVGGMPGSGTFRVVNGRAFPRRASGMERTFCQQDFLSGFERTSPPQTWL